MRKLSNSVWLMVFVLTVSRFMPAQCTNWEQAIAKDFSPTKGTPEQALRKFAELTPDQYHTYAEQRTIKAVNSRVKKRIEGPKVEGRMRQLLAKFYDAGYQLYGIRLNPNNISISSDTSLNAFSVGSVVVVNVGEVIYFLNPMNYLKMTNKTSLAGSQPDQFGWTQDWDSLAAVLAHEAAHNLMRHRDFAIVYDWERKYNEVKQAVLEERRDVAEGRPVSERRRYMLHSAQKMYSEMIFQDERKDNEREADAVGMLLLEKSGMDPAWMLNKVKKYMYVLGTGKTSEMNAMFCTSHPDWIERAELMKKELKCLRKTGDNCEAHRPYPFDKHLAQLKKSMESIDRYRARTNAVAKGEVGDPDTKKLVEFEVLPEDATLLVDGRRLTGTKVHLPIGPHSIRISHTGFKTEDRTIVVYPDVIPKPKIKMTRKIG